MKFPEKKSTKQVGFLSQPGCFVKYSRYPSNKSIAAFSLTQDSDGGVELALVVEERRVVHLGEGFVGVGVAGRAFHARPGAYGGAPPDYAGGNQGKGVRKKNALQN